MLPSSPASKTQQATKHVDGTGFPYLDASSNLASSTPKNPNLLKNCKLGFFFFGGHVLDLAISDCRIVELGGPVLEQQDGSLNCFAKGIENLLPQRFTAIYWSFPTKMGNRRPIPYPKSLI